MFKKYDASLVKSATPVIPLSKNNFEAWLNKQDDTISCWIKSTKFSAESAKTCMIPNAKGCISKVLLGVDSKEDFMAFGALPEVLPEGEYYIDQSEVFQKTNALALAALAWGLGYYQYDRYKSGKKMTASLILPEKVDKSSIEIMLSSLCLGRDLINTPAEEMGPDQLESAILKVADEAGASCKVIKNDEELKRDYPALHAVGRASDRAPRVLDLRWGNEKNPKITLVGKGVCFDSGGLDLKNPSGMLLMKKDMGGSAMVLALARLIMLQKLPVSLRLLVGAVENSVSGNSYRPGDVLRTRAGKTVEVKNTDAEGRLVICDLLAEACLETPDMLIDFATLTGAARIALGEDIPAMYANNDTVANEVISAGQSVFDPVWRMPLIEKYNSKIKSEIADISNAADTPWGGSITAALFLQHFVDTNVDWLHFDVPAWTFKKQPGRPVGAEVFAVRALYYYLEKKYRA